MTRPIVNLAEAPLIEMSHGAHFAFSLRSLTRPIGAERIGANVTTVPPGKAAFPFHHHHANEEHFFILSGSGVLRVGDEEYPVRQHDYVVNPSGGPELAHQLINTGSEDLVYLAISTMVVPEVVGYPDSGKTGVRIGPGEDVGSRFVIQDDARNSVGYWHAEDGQRIAEILEKAK